MACCLNTPIPKDLSCKNPIPNRSTHAEMVEDFFSVAKTKFTGRIPRKEKKRLKKAFGILYRPVFFGNAVIQIGGHYVLKRSKIDRYGRILSHDKKTMISIRYDSFS